LVAANTGSEMGNNCSTNAVEPMLVHFWLPALGQYCRRNTGPIFITVQVPVLATSGPPALTASAV